MDVKFCPNCGKQLGENTSFCGECGHQIAVNAVQTIPEPVVTVQDIPAQSTSAPYQEIDHMVSGETVLVSPGKVVNKTVYILLALFLGGFGAHKFYTGRIGLGILYLVFFWTWIPGIIAAIEAIYVGIKKNSDAYGNITM